MKKKAIPIIIAIALICVVAGVTFSKMIIDKYSYGTEWADYNEYFDIYDDTEVPVILQSERIEEKAKAIGSMVYFDTDTIKKYFTVRFYVDYNENLLLYTTPTQTVVNSIGESSYIESGETVSTDYPISVKEDDTLYIAVDYIKKFIPLEYKLFEEPKRMQVYTSWDEKQVAKIKADTQVRWRGGVKSEILTEVSEGDVVEILEPMDDWTKVKTDNCFIGYVPNSKLGSDEVGISQKPLDLAKEEEFSSLNRGKKINLTWHNIEYPQDGNGLMEACASVKSVNVISPTWFWVNDNAGNLNSVANADYVNVAHKMGMEVWALVSNFHSGTDVDTYELLSYTSKRTYLINSLVEQTLFYGADGINVDFEQVPSKAGESYIQFIRELALKCHENNLVLSVDNYVPSEYTAYYNRKEQGLFADYVIIMGYDEHYAGSEVGSVASMGWMKQGIEDTLKVVPAEKVINGVPFYTRVWMTEGANVTSEAVDMTVANNFLAKNGLTAQWDEETNQNYAETTIGNTKYQVWMEDADSIKVRLNVMNTFGIAGVASWKLGQETPEIWDLISAYMAN
ncbi:MAG: chitinase [Lachnospiraceae bacterium]|nr:chitinase [Lachnospiraceae bacterium]